MFSNDSYTFQWADLGDLEEGRPSLGPMMHVAVYRLMQYTLREVLNRRLGHDEAANILRAAGHRAGTEFATNVLHCELPLWEFLAEVGQKLLDLKVGILRIEESDQASLGFTLTVSEDLDCSGLPLAHETVCDYDEGFIAGIFETYTGRPFTAKEVDCWASGERTCRFAVKPVSEPVNATV